MTARAEELMSALLNGGTVNFAPHSRMEEYLMRCLEGGGTEGLPTPISRIDAQLYELVENGGAGTGGGTYVPEEDVATNEEVKQVIDEVFDDGTVEASETDEVFDNPVVN